MLALTADEAVMRSDRGYFCLPEADLGLPFTPAMSALLTSRLSPGIAHRAMVSAHRYGASEALGAGIVTECAASEPMLECAISRARALASKPQHVLKAIKRGLYGAALELLEEVTNE